MPYLRFKTHTVQNLGPPLHPLMFSPYVYHVLVMSERLDLSHMFFRFKIVASPATNMYASCLLSCFVDVGEANVGFDSLGFCQGPCHQSYSIQDKNIMYVAKWH